MLLSCPLARLAGASHSGAAQGHGVGSYLTSQEDADATYILSGDYDIALYCMIADKNGDPYYFIDTVLRPGGYWVSAGFESDEASELIAKLQVRDRLGRARTPC